MDNVKGVILHGGLGTRLRPLTFSGPKQLIPIANKPVSQYVLEDLVSCGVRDVAIILGDLYPERVVERYGDGSRFGCRITYINQGKPLGIAHAVGLAREFVGEDPFVVYLGDNLLQGGIGKYLERFLKGSYDAYVLLKEVEDPRRFGVAQLDERGNIVRLVEKPKDPPSRYALVGVYFFRPPAIFEAIRDLKPSWRGELEITDAIQMLIDRGYRVGYSIVDGWWLDIGKKDDVLTANAIILDERAMRDIRGEAIDSKIEGRVFIDEGAKIVRSVVRGPAVIGRNTLIEESFVGPYTSVGDNVVIKNSSLEYSVVLENAVIIGIHGLEESLVGRNARIVRNSRRGIRLNVGDFSEVEV
ncbi:MAG: glucose-1-phosphate thymidylyltransferase [Desulfurococcales archaeon]